MRHWLILVVAAAVGTAAGCNVSAGGDDDQHLATPDGGGCTSDEQCAAADPAAPLCAPDGVCGACRDSADCADPAAPVCDPAARVCRGCGADAECGSGVCDTAEGTCVAASDVIVVDDDAACGSGDGSAAAPACSIAEGLALYAAAPRSYLLARAGSYTVPPLGQATLPWFVGAPDAVIAPASPGETCIAVAGSAAFALRGFHFTGCAAAVSAAATSSQVLIERARIEDADVGVECRAPLCVLQGVRVAGGGIGVRCLSGARCKVVDVDVEGAAIGVQSLAAQLEMEGGAVRDAGLVGVDMSDSETALRGVVVTGTGQSVTSGNTAGIFCVNGFCELRGVRVAGSAGPGLLVVSASYDVRACVFQENGATSAQLPWGGGVVLSQPGSTKVFEGNTVVGNSAQPGAPGGVSCDMTAPVVGSIVWGNLGGDEQVSTACAVSYSDVDQDVMGVGNIRKDPMLDGYHLQAGSPCIDASDPTMASGTDVDGEPRPMNGRADIGADELAP